MSCFCRWRCVSLKLASGKPAPRNDPAAHSLVPSRQTHRENTATEMPERPNAVRACRDLHPQVKSLESRSQQLPFSESASIPGTQNPTSSAVPKQHLGQEMPRKDRPAHRVCDLPLDKDLGRWQVLSRQLRSEEHRV